MKRTFFVRKDGYTKTVEEVHTVKTKSDMKNQPTLHNPALWKDAFK